MTAKAENDGIINPNNKNKSRNKSDKPLKLDYTSEELEMKWRNIMKQQDDEIRAGKKGNNNQMACKG